MRTLFSIIAVACVLLAGWKQVTATRLWVEPYVPPHDATNSGYNGKAMVVHGWFFCLDGSLAESVDLAVFHTAPPNESLNFKTRPYYSADRGFAGFYTFAIEAPAVSPRGRCDIGVRTATGDTAQLTLGDPSLPTAAPTGKVDNWFGPW